MTTPAPTAIAASAAEFATPVGSPCIGICRLDEATGLCLGCARSGVEIAEWAGASGDWKQTVWQALPERFEAIGAKLRLLPWSPADIADVVARVATTPGCRIEIGLPTASAQWPGLVTADVKRTVDAVIARAPGGSLRLRLHPKLRAVTFGPDPTRSAIALCLPRGRLTLPVATAVTEVGADSDAIDPRDATRAAFDIGLGERGYRFMVRVGDDRLAGQIRAGLGAHWTRALGGLGPALHGDGLDRVVESQLARIEVTDPITRPGVVVAGRPRTHLAPALAPAVALAVPEWAALIAIVHPASDRGPAG